MKKVKIAAVGLGRLGYQHAENLAFKIPGAELIALCDTDAKRLNAIAQEWGIPHAYTDFDEMIRSGQLDAVVIAYRCKEAFETGELIKL